MKQEPNQPFTQSNRSCGSFRSIPMAFPLLSGLFGLFSLFLLFGSFVMEKRKEWKHEMNRIRRKERNKPPITVSSPGCLLVLCPSLSFVFLSLTMDERREGSVKRKETKRKRNNTTKSWVSWVSGWTEWKAQRNNTPGCYQRLEFYIQVLRVLCPNLTDASLFPLPLIEERQRAKNARLCSFSMKGK